MEVRVATYKLIDKVNPYMLKCPVCRGQLMKEIVPTIIHEVVENDYTTMIKEKSIVCKICYISCDKCSVCKCGEHIDGCKKYCEECIKFMHMCKCGVEIVSSGDECEKCVKDKEMNKMLRWCDGNITTYLNT